MSKPIDVINFRKRIKIALVKAFGGRCQHCEKEFPAVVFDFHHLNPEEKSFGRSNCSTTRAKTAYAQEAKKCCMLCANCHRLVENGEFDGSVLNCNFDESIYYATLEELANKQKKNSSYEEKQQAHLRKPDRDTLKSLIRTTPFTHIGNMFEVSDNAVRKWCKIEKLPSKKKEIKNYSNEEWLLI